MNLIAEQRPDKNGKMVTRWVKPPASNASLDKLTISPSIATSDIRRLPILRGAKLREANAIVADSHDYNFDYSDDIYAFYLENDLHMMKVIQGVCAPHGYPSKVATKVMEKLMSLGAERSATPETDILRIQAHVKAQESDRITFPEAYEEHNNQGSEAKIITLIDDNWETVDELIDFYNERSGLNEEIDADTFVELWNSYQEVSAPSLANGIL